MSNFFSAIPSTTKFILREDPLADPTPTPGVLSSQVPIVVDNTPLPPIAMLAIKIYAFGGLAFLFGVILTGIAYWIWVVVIKGEFADSPPELDIHPERMREKEKARMARLQAQKEKREAKRKRREEEKWRIPVRCEKKGRNRSTTHPAKSAIRKSSTSLSASESNSRPAKKKQVSWASSMLTIDVDGNLTTRPLEEEVESRPASRLQKLPPAHTRRHIRRTSS